MSVFEFVLGLIVGFYLLYYYLTKNFDYWAKRNVNGPKPKFLYGTSKDFSLIHFYSADNMQSIYDEYPKEPAVGLYARTKPVLLIKDLDMIKDVLVKNFTIFPNRGFHIYVDIEPLAENLFAIDYALWKPLRKTLAPVFTSGKLKDMFYLINECAEYFVEYMKRQVEKNEIIDCRELTAKYTTDAISVCAFGLPTNTLSDDDTEFRKYGRAAMADTWSNRALFISRMMPYWGQRILTPMVRDEKMDNFFINIIKNTMEYRKKNNVRRNDFVDLLMDMRDHPEQVGEKEITDIFITAQAFIFFMAGFDTASSAISHAFYELALNPDIQDRLRVEVTETCDKNGGHLTYDIIKNMKYLDKVFKETLRKYPSVLFLSREAAKDHTFEGTNISVSKGTSITIPIYAIHHDPRIYPDPEKFDPDRFDDDVTKSRPQMSYLPFGDGPRMCIGDRFGTNQAKLGLAAAVKNFKFELCDKTPKIYKKKVAGIVLAPESGLYLKYTKLT